MTQELNLVPQELFQKLVRVSQEQNYDTSIVSCVESGETRLGTTEASDSGSGSLAEATESGTRLEACVAASEVPAATPGCQQYPEQLSPELWLAIINAKLTSKSV